MVRAYTRYGNVKHTLNVFMSMMSKLLHHKYKLAILASLLLSTAVCIGMLILRMLYTREWTHALLVWNLFLAWIPLMFSFAAHSLYAKRTFLGYLSVLVFAVAWLVFFPNALYVITDLVHLQPQVNVPLWFDLILIVSFAWTSYLLGIVSLYLMQSLVADSLGTWSGWLFAVITLGLGSIGVYFGRFLRWNSWDLFLNPQPLVTSIWNGLNNPLAYPRTLVFSILFSLFFISTYITMFTLTLLPQERQNNLISRSNVPHRING